MLKLKQDGITLVAHWMHGIGLKGVLVNSSPSLLVQWEEVHTKMQI